MRILTRNRIKNIETTVLNAREHSKNVRDIKQIADEEAREVIAPTRDELAILYNLLEELEGWNELTFEYAEQIEELESKPNVTFSVLNQIKKRNERANRRAFEIKKRLKRNLNQYVMFNVPIPKDNYGNVEYQTYKYDKINGKIKQLIEEVNAAYSDGEQLVNNLNNI